MEQAMTRRADSLDSTIAPAMSPQRDSNPPTSSTTRGPIDRRTVMTRAHIVAKRFRDVLPTYAAALQYALRVVWADEKARQEHRHRFAGYPRRVLSPEERRASERATRRCGSSYAPF
jgi:hypothetical protein